MSKNDIFNLAESINSKIRGIKMADKIEGLKDMLASYTNLPKKQEKKTNPVVIVLAVIGAIAFIAAIAYAVYYFFIPEDSEYFEDFDEDDDDDYEDSDDLEGDE